MTGHLQPPPSQPGTVFVGREREMAVLREAVAAALGGHGRLVLLAGEPGIGKTRLAEELARHATAAGAVVRWGRCREDPDTPAFWPWIQILRALIRETDPEALRARLGAGAGEIVRLVPELRDRVPGVAGAPLADDAGARFRLFDSVVGFLCASASAQPLTLILEDLHWAQPASLDLLRFLVEEMREARMVVVGTYRDVDVAAPHPLVELLGALPYQPLVQRVDLEGLSADEIGALIEALGSERSPALVARVHAESGGNPFFATEIVRGLGTAGAGIRGTVRDAVGRRLRRLSEGCRRVLGIAAVIGPEFALGILERVAVEAGDCPPVLRALSEARDAHLVVELPHGVGGYRFAHALIREVLYTGLPLEARLRVHWHIATALEAQGGVSRGQGASALAHHFAEAIAGCAEGAARRACVDKAVGYATTVAEQATAMCAYAEAADYYERALRLLETWAGPDPGRRCELLLAMGEAQRWAGVPDGARNATFHRAAVLARELADSQRLARAALGLAETANIVEMDGALIGLVQEALDAVGPGDSSVRARLLGSLALARYLPDPQLHSARLSAEAVAMARRVGDLRRGVLLSRWFTLTEPAHAAERLALLTEGIRFGEQAGDREMVMYARLFRLYERHAAGQLAAAERELGEFSRLADELRTPFFRARALAVRAALALLTGDFAEVERLTQEAARLMAGADEMGIAQQVVAQLSQAYWQQGRLADLTGMFVGTEDRLAAIPDALAPLALFYAEVGRVDEARAVIEHVAAGGLETFPHHLVWLLNMTSLARACAIVGDTARAATIYPLLLPYAPHLVAEIGGPICVGAVSLYLGLLAETIGRRDDALRHFDAALAIHQRIPSPPWIAHTQYETAAVLLARDGPGDGERARALLAEVLQTTERLGMRGLQKIALALWEPMDRGVGVGADHAESRAASAPPCGPPLVRGDEKEGPRWGRGGLEGGPRVVGGDSEAGALAPPRMAATFRQEGDYWLIGYKGPVFRLKDRIGLHYLAVLLREPGRAFLATDLVAAARGGPDAASFGGGRRPALGVSEAYFDEQARREYARRLRDLRAVVEEAEEFQDRERASRAQAEIDVLAEELQRGLGLGGRVRVTGSPIERARVTLTHSVKTTLRAIAECDAELGHYLAATIKTGTYSSYSPHPRDLVRWDL